MAWGKGYRGKFEHVIGFDRKAPTPQPPGCRFVPDDVASAKSVHEGLRFIHDHHDHHHRIHIASVIHLAAYYDFFGGAKPKKPINLPAQAVMV